MKETGSISKSQYAGTTKDSTCSRCLKDMNNLSRKQQDQHEINCKKQEKLFQ